MLSELKENELTIATNLINGGLSMAKSCMEQILQSPMDLKTVDYGSGRQKTPIFNSEKGGMLHLIKTELKGQLTGSCYLIFSEEEVDSINRACLPKEIWECDSEESEMMKMAFLTEIDNMVAAAVVTEFSNILDLELYGDVPTALLLNVNHVDHYLNEESSSFETIVHFKAIFHGKELNIAPDFIWMFSDKLVDKIKGLV